ncbi:hypothetical protein Q5741_09995 [Paenibacillus sp. JX-17]|uniref:MerR family transcriptional regulator n=1 Tax=Paenibacillus lacisoli TaxID=3064525 RepID=A0ABT9CBW6_9BACL|nr:hypothetical protein [Paenibacillus sp. JX-17]MDO7906754.1 hypothetical protein [Paenibacillus sp. JX-17]
MMDTKATSAVAKGMGIGASTLRKYAAALEEQGYRFERAANKSRLFNPEDIETVRGMMTVLREHNLSLVQAASAILGMEDNQNAIKADTRPAAVSLEQEREQEHEQVFAAEPAGSDPQEPGFFEEGMNRDTEFMMKENREILLQEIVNEVISYVPEEAVINETDVQEAAVVPTAELHTLEELHNRIRELEEQQQALVEMNASLLNQLEEQRNWIKEKMDGERDRQLVTNLRTYQGRKRKPRSSFFTLFGLWNKKHREA